MSGDTMWACRFHAARDLELVRVPLPVPLRGEVVVQTRAASICYSDIRVYLGQKHAVPNTTLGHEIAGEVAAVGEGVDDLAVGQSVAVYPIVACGRCVFCLQGRRNRCLSRVTLGYELDGGLAEYVRVPAAAVGQGHVMVLPQGLDFELAAMAEPFACTLNSIETCRVGAGATVAILGAGPMGLMNLLVARALGASQVVVSDPVAERRQVAIELGATTALDPREQSLEGVVAGLTGGLGADAVILTVGDAAALPQAVAAARRQGVVNLFAGFPPQSASSLDPNLIHYSEVVLTGTQNATPDQFRRGLGLMVSGQQVRRLVTDRFALSAVQEAFQARLGLAGLKSMIFPDSSP